MADYTPTTEVVRAAYEGQLIKIGENRYEFIDETQANSEFDRWLNEVKAQAWEEGYIAGEGDGHTSITIEVNPYREVD